MSWTVGLASGARRDLDRLPPRIVPAVIEFVYGPLAANPQRLGKPLRGAFDGRWSARRGDYRVLFVLDAERELLVVVLVAHRSNAYRGS